MRVNRRIKPIGAVGRKWLETRDKWLEGHKAPYYFCHYCNKMMTRTELTLDHYKSRSRYPALRYKLSNLVPCCLTCNTDKGSLDGDKYLEKLKERDAETNRRTSGRDSYAGPDPYV